MVQAPATDLPRHPHGMAIGAVDHRALFPRASVVVHHGGAGTTHAACAAGVPSVVVPHVGDQRYWAERLHRLGVAPPAITIDRLAGDVLVDAVIETADDTATVAAARRLAASLAHENGAARAVQLIESAPGAAERRGPVG